MCNICGLPDYLRCDCVSTQPYCDQCTEDSTCTDVMDLQCVFYHYQVPGGPTPPPTQLINLGLPNGSSGQTIIEAIDALLGTSFNIPFAAVDTDSIAWTPGGPAGHNPSADVQISEEGGNQLVLHTDGLYCPSGNGKVKVDATDDEDYLELQIIGASSASGGYGIDVVNTGGVLVITPFIDVETLGALICEVCSTDSPSGGPACDDIEVFGTFALGVPSNGLIKIPVTSISSGQVTITATNASGSIFGGITQVVPDGNSFIYLPIFYDGAGSDGTQTITIDFDGFTNDVSCETDVSVAGSDDCTPVTIAGSPDLPNATAGTAYSYTIGLNGTQPFNLTDVIKPGWMSIAVVGGTIVFSGTPTGADSGIDLPVSFTVHNCTDSEEEDFADTFSVYTVAINNISGSVAVITGISGITGFTFVGPINAGGHGYGIHSGFTGSIGATVTGTPLSGSWSLYKNGTLLECSNIGFAGTHSFGSQTFLATDRIEVRWFAGAC